MITKKGTRENLLDLIDKRMWNNSKFDQPTALPTAPQAPTFFTSLAMERPPGWP